MTRNESDSTNKSQMRTEDLNDYVPAKRPGNDKDMAQAVLSLACNQYINGTILPVEGEITCMQVTGNSALTSSE